MPEFEVGGHTYRTKRLNARAQLHLLRGVGPLFGPLVQFAVTAPEEGQNASARQLMFMGPFFRAFASMEKHEVDDLVNQCLAGVQRRAGANGQGEIWMDLWNPTAGREQFEDYDLTELVHIAWNVIQENLSGFFATGLALPNVPGDAEPQTPSLGLSGLASQMEKIS
jgi:hypothetical protein